MKRPFKRILYGGDYNPNQWGKEIWKEDMRIFKDARIILQNWLRSLIC